MKRGAFRDSAIGFAACLLLGLCAGVLPARAACFLCRSDVWQRTNGQVRLNWSLPEKRVVLLASSIELAELTSGGTQDVNAEWSEAAKKFLVADLADNFHARGVDLVVAPNFQTPREDQLNKLHDVVSGEILRYAHPPEDKIIRDDDGNVVRRIKVPKLPKGDDPEFHWTLGDGVTAFRTRFNADYGLFINVGDTYSSDARRAFLAAISPVTLLSGGKLVASASLVDLRTGDIVWFALLEDRDGDLRSEKPAHEAVEKLFESFPR